jgi:phospholipid/cholesterol/gamma-HCH transport system substrate-binding protein
METRARHLLVGLFSLAVIGGALWFVYWLHSAGGLGGQTSYLVRFEGSAVGLRAGSAVLFNGIRVGEVTSLRFDPDDPRQVIATISAEQGTPIRSDTQVGVESQGLMGAPAVALRGGSRDAAALTGSQGKPGVLVADAAATEDVSQAARETLRLIRTVVMENAEPLRSTVGHLNTFTGALARNSDRLDGLLDGLERLTGGGSANKPVPVYDLVAPRNLPASPKSPTGRRIVVPEPAALVLFDTQRVLVRRETGETVPLENAQWSDSLPKLLQAKVIQTFENGGFESQVTRPMDDATADYQLLLEIRSFQVLLQGAPTAEVELSAKIVGEGGRVLASRTFRSAAPVQAVDPPAAVAGLAEAFGKAATDLVVWTIEAT